MRTYLEEYKRKLITAEQAAKLVESNVIVDYGMFATKPVDFDRALGQRVGDGLENVAIRATGSVLPIPEVIKMIPSRKPSSISLGILPCWTARQEIWGWLPIILSIITRLPCWSTAKGNMKTCIPRYGVRKFLPWTSTAALILAWAIPIIGEWL